MNTAQQKTVRIGDKSYTLPIVLRFFGNTHFYEVVGYRAPCAGEFYISGAIPEAYYTANDLQQEFLIAVPRERAMQVKVWVKAR